ncbi:putative endo-beta-1,4-glucanase D [Psilocybe cubensis]|uniref:AA9 family lytic polysaccharide monooxygenase n=2 Tax=Psilocybe cubensis TaxID=181762 RepID=A0A8H8CQG0_PSICU|nr:putative endo-beta-1,4-glucanase D [Psilocybe cubensis]KAH9485654.1 putative endo-beta-1,4-glucanase D [Psilocybe cubensis]
MKFSAILASALLATQSVSAHYIFKTVIAGDKSSTAAVRQPQSVEPFHGITSPDTTCNHNPSAAQETVEVPAGGKLGFQLSNNMYHQGPVSIYLGKAPGSAADWDGSGQNWFKIAEWGASNLNPLQFSSVGMSEFLTSIPENTPPGEYLARIEQIALHLGTGVPEIFVSCAQIKVTGGGSGTPPTVSIPGYIQDNDPGVTVDIYNNKGKPYTVPGPAVWRG